MPLGNSKSRIEMHETETSILWDRD